MTSKPVDVRRLAAVDLHGLNGTAFRRRLIIAEFLFGALGGFAIGLYLLVLAGGGTSAKILGIYAIGVAANYVPLLLHALTLRRPHRLRQELSGVDLRRELRHYTVAQMWVFVPFAFTWFALSSRR